ncbi:MAG: hypothetical protein K0R25_1397 [Rickettsiaceae bacterium]|nr:hypothetical protein [Rickettsiaceae bacterium]
MPALKFDGGDWIRATIPAITSNTLEVFTVCKRIALVSNAATTVFYKTGAANDSSSAESFIFAWERLSAPYALAIYRAGSLRSMKSLHPGNNIPYIFSTSFDGTDNVSYYNGTAQTAAASTGNFGFDNVLIGSRWESNVPSVMYNGYIGELIVFNRVLTATERKDVTKYLGDKWGIKVQ